MLEVLQAPKFPTCFSPNIDATICQYVEINFDLVYLEVGERSLRAAKP